MVAWNALDAAIVVQDYNHLLHNSTVALLHRSKSDEVLVAVDDCSLAVDYVAAAKHVASVLPEALPSTDCRLRPQKFEVAANTALDDPNKEIFPVGFLPRTEDAVQSMEIDALVRFPCMEEHVVVVVVAHVCTEIAAAAVETADYKKIDAADTENDELAAAVAASEMDQAIVVAVASPFYTVSGKDPYYHYTVNTHSSFDERSHQSNCQVDLRASFVEAVLFVKNLSSHHYNYYCYCRYLSSHY